MNFAATQEKAVGLWFRPRPSLPSRPLTVEFTGAPIMTSATRFVVILSCRETGELFVHDTLGLVPTRWYARDEELPVDCS